MEDIVNATNVEKFKQEAGTFNNFTRGGKPIEAVFKFEDYLKWCEIQKLDKLIELMEKAKI